MRILNIFIYLKYIKIQYIIQKIKKYIFVFIYLYILLIAQLASKLFSSALT